MLRQTVVRLSTLVGKDHAKPPVGQLQGIKIIMDKQKATASEADESRFGQSKAEQNEDEELMEDLARDRQRVKEAKKNTNKHEKNPRKRDEKIKNQMFPDGES